MEFRAGVYATGYFGHFLTVILVLLIGMMLHAGEYAAAGKILVVVAVVVARLYTRKMSFGDQTFRYDGWLRSIEIPYSKILKVESSDELGYPFDRTHGPNEFRLTTPEGRYWVSLMWFNYEASRAFYGTIYKQRPKRKSKGYEKQTQNVMNNSYMSWYSFDTNLKVCKHPEIDVVRALELVDEYYARGLRTFESGEDALAATMFGFNRSPTQFIEFCVHGPSEISYRFESSDPNESWLSKFFGDTFQFKTVLCSKDEMVECVREFFALTPVEIKARLQDE